VHIPSRSTSTFHPATYLNPCRGDIDFCFGGRQSVQEIYEACERSGGQWGMDAVSRMLK